jgi:hypothetical protein
MTFKNLFSEVCSVLMNGEENSYVSGIPWPERSYR